MSTELCTIKNTGPRFTDLSVTRFYGGNLAGVCVQLTAMKEDGNTGYVQLSVPDLVTLWPVLKEFVIDYAGENFGMARDKMPEVEMSDEVRE